MLGPPGILYGENHLHRCRTRKKMEPAREFCEGPIVWTDDRSVNQDHAPEVSLLFELDGADECPARDAFLVLHLESRMRNINRRDVSNRDPVERKPAPF